MDFLATVYPGGVLNFSPPNAATNPTFNINGGTFSLGTSLSTGTLNLRNGADVTLTTSITGVTTLVSASTFVFGKVDPPAFIELRNSPITIESGGSVTVESSCFNSPFNVLSGSLTFPDPFSYFFTASATIFPGASASLNSVVVQSTFNANGSLTVNSSSITFSTFNVFAGTTRVYGSVSQSSSFTVFSTLYLSAAVSTAVTVSIFFSLISLFILFIFAYSFTFPTFLPPSIVG